MPSWVTNYASAPVFVVDWNSVDRNTGRQIDWSRVPDSYKSGAQVTITTGAGAAAAAVAIPVTALTVALPAGTILNWTGAGETSILTAPAAVGATSLAVEPLDAAIEPADTAIYGTGKSGHKVIPGGTVMAQLASGKIVPRVVRPGSEEAIGLLISSAEENSPSDSLSGHGVIVGGVIYETLLPEVITAYKTELETNGTTFLWATYSDSSEA